MKKFFALILVAFALCFTLFLASCDYKETVDSAREDLMDAAKDWLDPFLNQQAASSNSGTASSVSDSADVK